MKRRDFLRVTLVGGAAAAVAPLDLWGKGTGKSGFTLWQLPSQVDTIGNSFVFLTDKGRVVVMDGGMNDETLFLRGFIAALGNEVECMVHVASAQRPRRRADQDPAKTRRHENQ